MRWLGLIALLTAACSANALHTPAEGGASWSGEGLVVHEWGTHTLVVGSDGSLLRGLHHEEEDLPSFVYDRIKQGGAVGPVIDKMETPVLYFYSPSARTMQVSVDFPRGIMTQWFPVVKSYYPEVAHMPPNGLLGDPALDPGFPFDSAQCRAKFPVANGLLDWGEVQLLGRGEAASPPEAPLERYGWSYARRVAANGLRVGRESEQFLFYRGLGNLTPPALVRADGESVVVENGALGALGPIFVLDGDRLLQKSGLGAGESWHAPFAGETVADAAGAVTAALDATGLFHDEAQAMVATWRRQWLDTPGLRVLYLAPAAWTDAELPLHLDPKPDAVLRVMVVRVELLRPSDEAADLGALAQLADSSTAQAGAAHFRALGRFAEPHLRRALALAGDPAAGLAFLAEISGPDVSASPE